MLYFINPFLFFEIYEIQICHGRKYISYIFRGIYFRPVYGGVLKGPKRSTSLAFYKCSDRGCSVPGHVRAEKKMGPPRQAAQQSWGCGKLIRATGTCVRFTAFVVPSGGFSHRLSWALHSGRDCEKECLTLQRNLAAVPTQALYHLCLFLKGDEGNYKAAT